jgi:Tol biopolymer transport system component
MLSHVWLPLGWKTLNRLTRTEKGMKQTHGYPDFRKLNILIPLIAWVVSAPGGELFHLASGLDPAQPAPAGGSGDSWAPIMSREGRFALFASTANNLLLNSNNTPILARFPANLNVFLRDRTNQTTTLVSVNLSGSAGGNGDSLPVDLSDDGRFALLESSASDLVPGDTNQAADIFVRDLVSNSTVLVSISTDGGVGNGVSRSPAMTPDGRFVAFVSAANDLVPDDTNGIPDVFVRDLQAGTTTLVSVSARGRPPSPHLGYSSESPQITPDGRYVAFYSTATNLVTGVPLNGDIYVRDLVGATTVWASSGARAATQAALHTTNVVCYNHSVSADGQFVAYEASPFSGPFSAGLVLRYNLGTGITDVVHTNAAVTVAAYEDIHNLDMTPDGRFIAFIANTNGNAGTTTCVCVWDAQSGAITLASGDPANNIATNSICDWPAINPSGRFVAFLSSNTNLVTNSVPGDYHLYLRDLQAGATRLVDVETNGAGSLVSAETVPSMTTNGGLVGFECPDGGLVPNDRNGDYDVFVRDWAGESTKLISAHHPNLPSRTPNGPSFLAANSVSSDGRWVAFASDANNLVANDTNRCRDVFVRDLATGSLTLVSVNTNGFCGSRASSEPAISREGRYVAFTSSANDLVPGDTNNASDVFLRDVQNGTTALVSMNQLGTGPGNKASYSPAVGAGGRFVLFRSQASTLVSASFSPVENLFLRDMLMQTNWALTTAGAGPAAMTTDGRFVAYATSNASPSLSVWDTQSAVRVYSNSLGGALVISVAIAANGQRIAYSTPRGLYLVQLSDGVVTGLDTNGSPACNSLIIDGTGRFITYTRASAANRTNQVYLCDLEASLNTLVSTSCAVAGPANDRSDSPVLSADGRFLAYRSLASDIVPGDTNGVPDIFLYDRQTGVNTLLSSSQPSGTPANNRSLTPIFSGDGSTLLFQSWASDLTGGDFNHNSDLFAYTFLSAIILPSASPGAGPSLSWPWVPGNNYRVEFKNHLEDSNWQPFSGTFTNLGNKAWLQDLSPNANQRYYRIVSF